MKNKILGLLVILLCSSISICAKEKPSNADDVITKMKIELNLTDEQALLIKPIIEESILKRQKFMHSTEAEPITNKALVKSTLLKFRKEENQELSKVLTQQQMDKRIEKQNLRDSLNRDQIFTTENQDEGVVMTPQGGSMQF